MRTRSARRGHSIESRRTRRRPIYDPEKSMLSGVLPLKVSLGQRASRTKPPQNSAMRADRFLIHSLAQKTERG